MSTLAFRRPTVLPIHPQTWTRPSGSLDFRVTQPFAVPDSFYGGSKQHNAVDLGNFRCGDAVVAMAPGVARRVQDNATALGAKTNALGMVIDHGDGVTSEYWHLNGYSVASGAKVATGQQIGIVGRTGLGDVCHLHVEVKRNGVRVDPEPLMFGGSLTIEEDDVTIKGRFLRHVQNRRGILTADSHFRAGVLAGDDASLGVLPKGTVLYPVWVVEGRAVGTAPDTVEWYGAAAYLNGAYQVGNVHSSVLPRTPDGNGVELEPIEATDCSRQDNALEAIATAAVGARQAIEAIERLAAQ